MKGQKLLIVMMVLGLLAIADTGYLVYLHYDTDITGFCQEGGTFDCSSVNKSEYASFFGVPVANLGVIFYVMFFLLSLSLYKGLDLRRLHPKIKRKHAYWLIFLIPFVGMLFALRLTYIEAFVLKAWCPFCVIQQGIVAVMLVVAYFLLKKRHLL